MKWLYSLSNPSVISLLSRPWYCAVIHVTIFIQFHLHLSSFSYPFAFPTSQAIHLRHMASGPCYDWLFCHLSFEKLLLFCSVSVSGVNKYCCTCGWHVVEMSPGLANRRRTLGGCTVVVWSNNAVESFTRCKSSELENGSRSCNCSVTLQYDIKTETNFP